MVRLKLALELSYEIAEPGGDFIFNIHAAHTPGQAVVEEALDISQPLEPQIETDPATANRTMRIHARPGSLKVRYQATLDVNHYLSQPDQLPEVPIARLPIEALSYIYPSRYCQSDRLHRFAVGQFGNLAPGYKRVVAIRDWVKSHVRFTSASTNSSTSAVDTLIEQVGVCRDFTHLMIALCRAVNIPARFATGVDYGADPMMGPTDFHAYVEAYLGDRWYMFDPSGTAIPMGFVRFGTGRDAADVAFATIFGTITSPPPVIEIEAVANADGTLVIPHHREEALSTDW